MGVEDSSVCGQTDPSRQEQNQQLLLLTSQPATAKLWHPSISTTRETFTILEFGFLLVGVSAIYIILFLSYPSSVHLVAYVFTATGHVFLRLNSSPLVNHLHVNGHRFNRVHQHSKGGRFNSVIPWSDAVQCERIPLTKASCIQHSSIAMKKLHLHINGSCHQGLDHERFTSRRVYGDHIVR